MVILKRLWPRGDNGQVISGSLQKYGSMTSLLACLEHQKIRAWDASKVEDGDQVGDEIIPALVSDLAFKMVHDLSREGNAAKKITAETWQGFKHFTEALDAYHQYNLTGGMVYLELARKECLNAAKAEIGYEKLLKLLYNLGMAYTNKKEYFMAEELFLQAINIKSEDAFTLFGLGYLNGVQEIYDKALGYLEKAIDLDPKCVHAWNGKGNTLVGLKRYEEALKCYEKAIELDPKYVLAWYNKGNAFGRLGENEEAVRCFDKALTLDPKFVHAWNGKGNALIDLGKHKEALVCFDKALTLDLKYVHAWNGKGNALNSLGKHQEALEYYDKAIDLDPKDVYAWNGKGNALNSLGCHVEALVCFDNALDLDPKYVHAWNGKGNALNSLGKYQEARDCYEKAIDLDPKFVHAWYNKGNALVNLEQWEEAIASYQETVELDPNFTMAWIALARLYRKLGREEESSEQCKSARDLIENENEYNRACFEAVCGSADDALPLLRSALEKKQATPERARQDPDLEFIRDDPRFQALLREFSEGKKSGSD